MSTDKRLKELAEIIKNSPKTSAKYKKAMSEIDAILGMEQEPKDEGYERYDGTEDERSA